MLKRTLLAAGLIIIIFTLAIFYVYRVKGILFHTIPQLNTIAAGAGIITGLFRGLRNNTDSEKAKYQTERHNIDSFLEHWGTAAGIIILAVSGLFMKIDYQRFFSINLHSIGLTATLFFGTYFLMHFFISKKYIYLLPHFSDIINGTINKYLFRKAWQDTGKYLSSQKSVFLVFSLLGTGILATGAIKVAAFYFSVPLRLVQTATTIHDIFAVLFAFMVLVHIFFSVITGSHRRLLKSWFTGKY